MPPPLNNPLFLPLYNTTTYEEFCLVCETFGIQQKKLPSRSEFNSVYPDDWKWMILCNDPTDRYLFGG